MARGSHPIGSPPQDCPDMRTDVTAQTQSTAEPFCDGSQRDGTGWRRSIVAIVAVAITYFVTGRLGLQLAIPPGYATAVWPPSGIALAAVLLAGAEVWPGVLVGSFLVNISTGFDASTVESLGRSLIVPTGIACGATLQSVGGGFLVKRFGDFPNPLRTAKQIGKLLLLGGGTACVINASISVGLLVATGRVPLASAPFTWATWWGGDTIGVFVFTPMALTLLMRPRTEWNRRSAIIVTAVVATFASCVVLVAHASHLERKDFGILLAEKGESLSGDLAMTVAARLDAVEATQAFLAHSENITREEFASFSSNLRAHIPGVLALEWIPRVSAEQRTSFESKARSRGLSDFRITENTPGGLVPASSRPEYFPVTYFDPPDGNKRAMGFDVASDDERRTALDTARSTKRVAITGRITLVQGGEGVLAAAPVYRKIEGDARDESRDSLAGFALAVLSLAELTQTAFERHDLSQIHYWITDETFADSRAILASSEAGPPSSFKLVERGLFGGNSSIEFNHTLNVGGRRWTLRVVPTQIFITAHRSRNSWFILLGGLLASGLVGAFAMVVTGRESELLSLVDQRTKTLQTALTQLERSEERYRVLFTGSGVPMLLVDPSDGTIVDANSAASAYYGHTIERFKEVGIAGISTLSDDALAENLKNATGHGINHFYSRHRLSNGEVRDVEIYSGPV